MTDNPYLPPSIPTSPPPLPQPERSPWNGWWTLLWAVILFAVWQIVMTIGLIIAAFQTMSLKDFKDPESIEQNILALTTDGDVIGLVAFSTIFFVCPTCWLIGQVRP